MATTSQVDASIPADGVAADKAEFRANFATIKSEITSLIRKTRMPYQAAFDLATSLLNK
jgi:hypothetical protein